MNRIALAAFATLSLMTFMRCSESETAGSYIGPADLKVADGKMTPELLLSLGRLSDPQLSPDGKTILYGVSYTSIAENRSCRNLFICNVDGSGKTQLTKDGKSISAARWALDGKAIFFLQGGQLWKAPYKDGKLGKRTKLSDVAEGIGDYLLSPDQSKVIFVSTVPSNVKTPADSDPALDKAKAFVAEDLMYRHWDHWVTELPHSYVATLGGEIITKDNSIDILGGPDVKFELPIEPFGGAEQLCWSPDGRFIAYSCKKLSGKQYAFSTNTNIYIFCPETGKTTAITCSGGYDTDPVWSPDGSRLAWLSMARDGYEADQSRLALADLDFPEGENPSAAGIRYLKGFDCNVAGPVWSADSKSIYFNALYSDAVQGIFRVCAKSLETPELLTARGAWYDFGSPFGILEDGTLLATWASMDFPTELVAVKDGLAKSITNENEHLLGQLTPHRTEKRMVKTVDGKEMVTWVLFPPDFDETKTYPAIEILLGGPQGTLSQEWSYRWNYYLMCNQGYVVVLPNRRGTTAFGQEWCEQISGDYIGLNMQDYISAGKMIKAEPYIGKLAACGASYGGYSVYYMAGINNGLYDCFIAHAGIFDEKYMYYETEEMWFPNWDNGGLTEYAFEGGQMGHKGDGKTFGGMQQAGSPWSDNPKARRHYANSPASNIQKWNTPILCIHGMMDFRIPYDQGMAAFNAAQMMGVPSKLIIFPEENHWILKPQNALFWHRSYFEWLDQWCK